MHTLPKLNYEYDALEPFIDARTMEIHHTKHHQTYVDKLNAALEGHKTLQGIPVEELLKTINSIPKEIQTQVKNHGGGHANHSFFWQILKKDVHFNENSEIGKAIVKKFGSYENFKDAFTKTATARFGSGWAWLIKNKKGDLEIIDTPNQDSPLMEHQTPVIGLDVWEHAYYLKYQNKRPEYIESFFHIINWHKVDEFYKK